MRPVTLLTQSFLFVTSVVALPAILQPRQGLAAGSAYVSVLEADVSALSTEITSITATDPSADTAAITAEIDTLTGDLLSLDAALSSAAPGTKRDDLSSPAEMPALQQRQTPPDVCTTAAAVAADVEAVTASVDTLLAADSLDPATAAEIETTLESLAAPALPLPGC